MSFPTEFLQVSMVGDSSLTTMKPVRNKTAKEALRRARTSIKKALEEAEKESKAFEEKIKKLKKGGIEMNYFQPIESYKGFNLYPFITNKSVYYEDSKGRIFGQNIEELKKAIDEKIKDGFYLTSAGMEPGEIEAKIRQEKEK